MNKKYLLTVLLRAIITIVQFEFILLFMNHWWYWLGMNYWPG